MVGKSEEKRQLGKPWRRLEKKDDMKLGPGE
jgi:hypothetical protein